MHPNPPEYPTYPAHDAWGNGTTYPSPLAQVTWYRKPTQHTFHLVLTIITFGCWFPVWMTVWAINSSKKVPYYTYRI